MKPSALYLALGPVRAGCGQSGCPSHSLGLPPPNPGRHMVPAMACSTLCLWRQSCILHCSGGTGVKLCGLQLTGLSKEGPFPGPAWGRPGRGYSVPRNGIPDKLGQGYSCAQGNFPSPPSRDWEPGAQLEGRSWRHASCDFSLCLPVLISVSRHIPRPSPCVV